MGLRRDWDHLLGRARGGDRVALGELIEEARADLQRAAGSRLGRALRRQLSLEDLLGGALVAVVREIHSLRATHYRGFRQWLATIAHNQLCRHLRREEHEPREALGEEDVACEDVPASRGDEELAQLRRSLARLPASQRIALVLREGLALPWGTLGFVLWREHDATRLVHYRALQHVRATLHFRRENAAHGQVHGWDLPPVGQGGG